MRMLLGYYGGLTEEMLAKLRTLGLEIVFLPGEDGRPGLETRHYDMDFSDIDAVICYQFFSFNDISRFPRLKYIHTTSHGLDHMPMDYIRAHGIRLCDARGVYGEPMAEYALGGVLQLYKQSRFFLENQKER